MMVRPESDTHGPDWQEESVASDDLPHHRRLVGRWGHFHARPVVGGSGVFAIQVNNEGICWSGTTS